MTGRLSTLWRFLRLVLVALVVFAPAVQAEPRSDRIALVQGGPGGRGEAVRQTPVAAVAPEWPRPTARRTSDETSRVVPRASSVARFLLHRALLN